MFFPTHERQYTESAQLSQSTSPHQRTPAHGRHEVTSKHPSHVKASSQSVSHHAFLQKEQRNLKHGSECSRRPVSCIARIRRTTADFLDVIAVEDAELLRGLVGLRAYVGALPEAYSNIETRHNGVCNETNRCTP